MFSNSFLLFVSVVFIVINQVFLFGWSHLWFDHKYWQWKCVLSCCNTLSKWKKQSFHEFKIGPTEESFKIICKRFFSKVIYKCTIVKTFGIHTYFHIKASSRKDKNLSDMALTSYIIFNTFKSFNVREVIKNYSYTEMESFNKVPFHSNQIR